MPTLRPRKHTKNVEPESEESTLSSPSPSPAPTRRNSKAKQADKKPRVSGRKSIAPKRKEADVITIDETGDNNKKDEKPKQMEKVKKQDVEEEEDSKEELEVYYELTEKDLKEINNTFDMNCSDGELIKCDDLKTAIRSMGYEPRADELKNLSKKYSNKDGKINRDSFQKIMAIKIGSSVGTKDNINDSISIVFNLFDLNKTGFITVDNLRSISREMNEEITEEELQEMLIEASSGGQVDGEYKISKSDFVTIMKKTSLY